MAKVADTARSLPTITVTPGTSGVSYTPPGPGEGAEPAGTLAAASYVILVAIPARQESCS